jgi:hypothetical protein
MTDVFISYANADKDHVERLVQGLREANIVGWLDKTDIAAGANISSEIRDAMRRSSAVIVFLSPQALQNQWVQFEVGAAEALDKAIIPVIVSGNELEQQLPEILKTRNVIDARSRSNATVVDAISRALEQPT